MKKKVLFISHMYPTSIDHSYGKVIHEQALSLINLGYEVKVICPIPYRLPFSKYVNPKKVNRHNIAFKEVHDSIEVYYPRYISFPKAFLFSQSGKLMYFGILKSVKKIKKNFEFDLIHAHFGMPDTYAANKLSKVVKKPVVSTLQATDLDITINRSESSKLKVYEALNMSKQVISPTPRLQKKLLDMFDIKSEVIGYGIDPQKVIVEKSPILTHKYKDKIVVLSVSRLIETKGLDYNIYAINKIRENYENIKYVIIGEGPEKENLERLVKSLDLEEYVDFLGELTSSETMKYIATSNIFSLPSWQETFGLVYVEAMANKKAVIGCEGQGFDGIILNKFNGFLAKPKNSNSIYEIIELIIENPSLLDEIGVNAQQTVINDFTFTSVARHIEKVYRNL